MATYFYLSLLAACASPPQIYVVTPAADEMLVVGEPVGLLAEIYTSDSMGTTTDAGSLCRLVELCHDGICSDVGDHVSDGFLRAVFTPQTGRHKLLIVCHVAERSVTRSVGYTGVDAAEESTFPVPGWVGVLGAADTGAVDEPLDTAGTEDTGDDGSDSGEYDTDSGDERDDDDDDNTEPCPT